MGADEAGADRRAEVVARQELDAVTAVEVRAGQEHEERNGRKGRGPSRPCAGKRVTVALRRGCDTTGRNATVHQRNLRG